MRLFSDASLDVADPWLRRAYQLAELGRGSTSPNPIVGCVIVAGGSVVGEGHHARAGGPHAEAVALAAAGEAARGAAAYVTLEPCNHEGRTPRCVPALVEAGIARVVIGMPDPNPDVTGGGAEALRSAGVDVEFAQDPEPFRRQNEAWVMWATTGRPWLLVKCALTLDGRPALVMQRRCRLTGPEAEMLTMRLRAASDAVMVGASTMRVDDPWLTVRQEDGEPAHAQPARGVISRTDVPRESANVFAGKGRRLLITSDRATADVQPLEDIGVEVLRYPYVDGIRGALSALGAAGITRVMLEAGPGLFTAAYEARVIDELVVYHAGGLGGNAAPASYLAQATENEGCLITSLVAAEAGLAGADAVTVWRRKAV